MCTRKMLRKGRDRRWGFPEVPFLQDPALWVSLGDSLTCFRERPRIRLSTLNVTRLKELPDGTLGREYVRFLEDNVSGGFHRVQVAGVDPWVGRWMCFTGRLEPWRKLWGSPQK